MAQILIQEAASWRLDEIYRYTRERWGTEQADRYITGLFDAFANAPKAEKQHASHPAPEPKPEPEPTASDEHRDRQQQRLRVLSLLAA